MGNFWCRFNQKNSYVWVAVVALLIGVIVTAGCTAVFDAKGDSAQKSDRQAQAAPAEEAAAPVLSLPGGDLMPLLIWWIRAGSGDDQYHCSTKTSRN